MRIARIATMAIALCAASASIASAQRPDSAPPGGRRGGMMGGRRLDGITLTDAQQVQVKTIREKYAPKMMELRDKMASAGMARPDSATMSQMMAITDAQTADIRLILTPEQRAILDKNIADEKERMKNRRPPGT